MPPRAVAQGRVYIRRRHSPRGTSNPSDPLRGASSRLPNASCASRSGRRTPLETRRTSVPYRAELSRVPPARALRAGGAAVSDGKSFSSAEGISSARRCKAEKVLWSQRFKRISAENSCCGDSPVHPFLDVKTLISAWRRCGGRRRWPWDQDTVAKKSGAPSRQIARLQSSPMICETGGKRQLIILHPESVTRSIRNGISLLVETVPNPLLHDACHPPRQLGDELLTTDCFTTASLMLRLDSVPKNPPRGPPPYWRTR